MSRGQSAGYWMNETSGALRPVIEAYLAGHRLTAEQCATMRAYLRHWMAADWQGGNALAELRADVDGLDSSEAIDRWLHRAMGLGIDPL